MPSPSDTPGLEQRVRAALDAVKDPVSGKGLVTSGRISGLVVRPDGKVGFEFQASAPRPGKPGAKPAADAGGAEGQDGGGAVATAKVVKVAPARAAAARAGPPRYVPAPPPPHESRGPSSCRHAIFG